MEIKAQPMRAAAPATDDATGNGPTTLLPNGPPAVTLQASAGSLTLDPDAVQGTRFTGPIMSGPIDEVAGIVLLHKRFKLSSAYGTFTVPVRLPPSAILMTLVVQIQQTYNGTTPKLNLGSTPNGLDIASVDLSVAPTQVFNDLTSILGSSWTFHVSQALTGATAGKATVLITYSVPAAAMPS
jgi:hypothetical protein